MRKALIAGGVLVGLLGTGAVVQSNVTLRTLLYCATWTGAVCRPQSDKNGDTVSVKDFGAKGDGTTDDTAAIQAAITATTTGRLWVPPGTYKVCTGLPIVITSDLVMEGAGWHDSAPDATGSSFKVCGGIANTIDVFVVRPGTSAINNVVFRNFGIASLSGATGRYPIHLDGSTGEIRHSIFDHLSIYTQSAFAAIYGDGTGLSSGTPTMSDITHSFLSGGIVLTAAGDTVRIRDNMIIGSGLPALDISFQAGSSTLIFSGNNVQADGGIHVGTASVAAQFIENEIETLGTFTGSNGSLLDIDGTTGSHAADTIIERNSFQVVNGITADGIRINYSDRAYIAGNRFGRGATTSHDITVTANASDTTIGHNIWASGSPYTSMVNNAGTRTQASFVFPGVGQFVLPNNLYYGSLDETGGVQSLIKQNTSGQTVVFGYRSQGAMLGANGSTSLYDGTATQNLGLTVSSAASTAPVNTTVTTVGQLNIRATAFASLPGSPTNGTMLFCNDCTIANPCAGGGTGALAKRLNGVWVCN